MPIKLTLSKLTLALTLGATAVAASANASEIKLNKIMVKMSQSKSAMTDLATTVSTISGVSVDVTRQDVSSNTFVLTVEGDDYDSAADTVIANLQAQPGFEWAEKDRILKKAFVPNDANYSFLWHYHNSDADVNVEDAWDITKGEGAVVAIIDTGSIAHPDLTANLLPGIDMIDNLGISNDGDGRDTDPTDPGDFCPDDEEPRSSWHGTHVAGTAAGVGNDGVGTLGVAFNSKIVTVRALGQCGGLVSDIADGIRWAAGIPVNGLPNNENPADVINLSLGGPGANCGNATQTAINQAVAAGAVIVVAAGNSDLNASGFTPANCDSVITVAAMNRDADRAFYSNFGSIVDIAAPGGDLQDPVISADNNGITTANQNISGGKIGTSMAAPHVAGIAALAKSIKPELTHAEVETIIKDTARNFTGNCAQCGSGMADATRVVLNVFNVETQSQTLDIGQAAQGTNIDKQFIIDAITNGPFNEELLAIRLTTLPQAGELSINGVAANINDVYNYTDINTITYQSESTTTDSDTLEWRFHKADNNLSNNVSTAFNITPSETGGGDNGGNSGGNSGNSGSSDDDDGGSWSWMSLFLLLVARRRVKQA